MPFQRLKVKDAACGAAHSAVVDVDGRAWTWGGGASGGAALGHGERKDTAPLLSTTDWMTKRVLEKRRQHAPSAALERHAKTRRDFRHAWPRRVEAVSGIASVACGERHTALVTDDRSVLLCGDGFAFLGGPFVGAATSRASV